MTVDSKYEEDDSNLLPLLYFSLYKVWLDSVWSDKPTHEQKASTNPNHYKLTKYKFRQFIKKVLLNPSTRGWVGQV
jgi:hypothetical protein